MPDIGYHKGEQHIEKDSLIREAVLGFNDGLVSILALVAGISGAVAENNIIILAGIAGLTAGAISMALAGYISNKSEIEYYNNQIKKEKWEMKHLPERETQEIRDIYRKKGFRGKQLESIVKHITSNDKRWLDVMMKEELGLMQEKFKSPAKSAVIIGIAFVLAAMVPIIPYFLFTVNTALVVSLISSLIVMFLAGAAKTKITGLNWVKSGLEMVFIGVAATVVTYFIGTLIPV